MQYDEDDPPPRDTWSFWFYANRWAEEMMRMMRVFGFLALCLMVSTPLMAHEMPGVPQENQAWYQNAETNVEARPTFPSPWNKCCNHAEVIDVKDIVFPTSEHGWQWNDKGEVKTIPDIIIHWSEAAPDNRPTLFVYLGTMTCFYPPQGGV